MASLLASGALPALAVAGRPCCCGVVRHRQPYWTVSQVSWVAPHCSSRQGGHGTPMRGSRLNRKAPKAPPGWQMCLKVELPGISAPATTCLLIPAWEGKRPRRPARAWRRLASDSPDVGKLLLSWSDSSHLFSSSNMSPAVYLFNSHTVQLDRQLQQRQPHRFLLLIPTNLKKKKRTPRGCRAVPLAAEIRGPNIQPDTAPSTPHVQVLLLPFQARKPRCREVE